MALIQYLTRMHLAEGALEAALPEELARLGLFRPLVVTDRGVRAAGLLDRLLAALPAAITPAVFDATPENPTEDAVEAALEVYRATQADGLIALGGGSPMDLAKGVALLAAHGAPLQRFAANAGGAARIGPGLPPLIAVPTTAGTGSEVGRGAVLVLRDRRKLGFLSPHLLPAAAICDPTLTYGLPAWLTAATGMDAVTHCVETYLSTALNPPADGIALEGLRLAAAHIERATADGRDPEARRAMMAAASCGALAFQKGLGAVHAMSHALGGLEGASLHHGALNAVLLPHVLRFNAPVVGHRYAALAQAMGLAPGADLAAALGALAARLGLPTTLGAMGVTEPMLAAAAPLAEADHTTATNPRPARAEDYAAMLREAF